MSQTLGQWPDGGWRPIAPLPLFVGWRYRKSRCQCGLTFRSREQYEVHWYRNHG